MTTLQHTAEHDAFIKWFKSSFPQLCKMHCMDILPAVDETGFIILWQNMAKEIFDVLLQVTNDYYYLMNK